MCIDAEAQFACYASLSPEYPMARINPKCASTGLHSDESEVHVRVEAF
jgi:hypothetical protein